jgi:alanine racemase
VELNAVVKADAYGHGMLPVGRVFEKAGADRLCVASFDEAVALRDAGIRIPILVLYPVPVEAAVAEAVQLGIELTLSDRTSEGALMDWFRRHPISGPDLVVHIEVDTGLTRDGFDPGYVASVVQTMTEAPRIGVAALWTHIATPEDEEFTRVQVQAFEGAVESVRAAGLLVPTRHIAASGGLVSGRVPGYEGVRIGLGLYGILPDDVPIAPQFRRGLQELRPALALRCRALRVQTFPAGTRVSYGGLWTAERDSVIATLPLGYGDGIPRNVPAGSVLFHGQRVPIIGAVAMDAVMVDITDVGGWYPDDEFVLLGRQGTDSIDAAELSRLRNTIPWEVVTSMSYRIPRVYHAGSVLMGMRTLDGEVRASEQA